MTTREVSKVNWAAGTDGKNIPTAEAINIGSLQRIADATEAMAKRHLDLIDDRERFRKWFRDEEAENTKLNRRIFALRGVITRQRKQIQALKEAAAK